jgi:hypothetical protein
MRRPSLLSGIAFAFAATVLVLPIWWSLETALSFFWAFRFAIIIPYCCYGIYLLVSSKTRIGNLTLTLINLIVASALLTIPTSNSLVITALAASITLNRSLLFHRSILSVTLDGFVSAIGLAFAGYLFDSTGSIPAALWSYLLTQSVFVLIPQRFHEIAPTGNPIDPFQRSRRQAQEALQRIVQAGGN